MRKMIFTLLLVLCSVLVGCEERAEIVTPLETAEVTSSPEPSFLQTDTPTTTATSTEIRDITDYSIVDDNEDIVYFDDTKWGMTKPQVIGIKGNKYTELKDYNLIIYKNNVVHDFIGDIKYYFDDGGKLYKIRCSISEKENMAFLEGIEQYLYALKMNNLVADKVQSIYGEPDVSESLDDEYNYGITKQRRKWLYLYNTIEVEGFTDIVYEFSNTVQVVVTLPSTDIDTICEIIRGNINSCVGANEKIISVSLSQKNLRVYVDLSSVNPNPLTFEDLAISRTESITDFILSHEEFDEMWDTVTVDFGSIGYITNDKANIKDDGYGRYFNSVNYKIK